jgi:hypothetical protein
LLKKNCPQYEGAGKCCVHFQSPDDLPLDACTQLLGDLRHLLWGFGIDFLHPLPREHCTHASPSRSGKRHEKSTLPMYYMLRRQGRVCEHANENTNDRGQDAPKQNEHPSATPLMLRPSQQQFGFVLSHFLPNVQPRTLIGNRDGLPALAGAAGCAAFVVPTQRRLTTSPR